MSDKIYTDKELRAEFRKDYDADGRKSGRLLGCDSIHGALVKIHEVRVDDDQPRDADATPPSYYMRHRYVEVTTRYPPGLQAGYVRTGNWGQTSDRPVYFRETYFWLMEGGEVDCVHSEEELECFAEYEREVAQHG